MPGRETAVGSKPIEHTDPDKGPKRVGNVEQGSGEGEEAPGESISFRTYRLLIAPKLWSALVRLRNCNYMTP